MAEDDVRKGEIFFGLGGQRAVTLRASADTHHRFQAKQDETCEAKTLLFELHSWDEAASEMIMHSTVEWLGTRRRAGQGRRQLDTPESACTLVVFYNYLGFFLRWTAFKWRVWPFQKHRTPASSSSGGCDVDLKCEPSPAWQTPSPSSPALSSHPPTTPIPPYLIWTRNPPAPPTLPVDHGTSLLGLSVVIGSARFLQLHADVVLIQFSWVTKHELLGKALQKYRRQMCQALDYTNTAR